MHLMPHETDKLALTTIGLLAQRRLARGLRLNYPETVALISTVILELIRDGQHSVSELMQIGQTILGKRETLPGVPAMVEAVHIEGTFPDGTKLVAIPSPVTQEEGQLDLALYGSFLPHPTAFSSAGSHTASAGAVLTEEGEITLNEGRATCEIDVTNTDSRPIQVGSHFHFIEANPRLRFDREAAYGRRLDIPAGNAVRFSPGETRRVTLVDIAGQRVIRGGNNFASGEVDTKNLNSILERIRQNTFDPQDS